jgi:hypothetical protein
MNAGYRLTVLFSALIATALAAQALAAPKLLSDVPLVWKPTSQMNFGAVQSSEAKIQFQTFKDVRTQPALIGENHEDSTPKPVTTKDDVGAFVTPHIREIFDRAGLTTVDSDGSVIITGEVRQFYVDETNTYKGDVALHIVVTSRSGKSLWEGNTTGSSSRFGRSYKLENYYETLSDAIIDATESLLQNPGFQDALKH